MLGVKEMLLIAFAPRLARAAGKRLERTPPHGEPGVAPARPLLGAPLASDAEVSPAATPSDSPSAPERTPSALRPAPPALDAPMIRNPVQVHAYRLLQWLHEPDPQPMSGPVLSCELQLIYGEMCAELYWAPIRWEGTNGVAHHFRRLVKSRKRYANVVVDGIRRKWTVFDIPPPPAVQAPDTVRETMRADCGAQAVAARRALGPLGTMARAA